MAFTSNTRTHKSHQGLSCKYESHISKNRKAGSEENHGKSYVKSDLSCFAVFSAIAYFTKVKTCQNTTTQVIHKILEA